MIRRALSSLSLLLALSAGAARADELPAAPWASAHGSKPAPLPGFLDTSDKRIKEDRPPPAPEQVTALRELEAELGRFRAVGGAYRDTLKGLLQREYDRQRHEREEAFNGQIKYEEDLEDKARLGIAQVITAGFPFVVLGVLARSPDVGILSDAVLVEISPLLRLGLGWLGFVAGFRFDVRAFQGLPVVAGRIVALSTMLPFVLVVGACAV